MSFTVVSDDEGDPLPQVFSDVNDEATASRPDEDSDERKNIDVSTTGALKSLPPPTANNEDPNKTTDDGVLGAGALKLLPPATKKKEDDGVPDSTTDVGDAEMKPAHLPESAVDVDPKSIPDGGDDAMKLSENGDGGSKHAPVKESRIYVYRHKKPASPVIDVDNESIPSVIDVDNEVDLSSTRYVHLVPLTVREHPKKPLPVSLNHHLPDIPFLTKDDNRRLQAYEERFGDEGHVVLQVHTTEIKVGDLRSCVGKNDVTDVVLNAAWKLITTQLQSSSHLAGFKTAYFPSFFMTKLMQEGHEKYEGYNYDGVRGWSKTFLGDASPLDHDIIVFLRNIPGHWFTYVMFPKHRHLEAFDSLGFTPMFKSDFDELWKWLNDDLRVHWGLKAPLDSTQWKFWVNRRSVPTQGNGYDCGLFAIHYGFCFGLQASLSGITQERISLYRKKLILYMLDGLPQRSILLTKPIWYEDFIVESPIFPTECSRLYGCGVPTGLVDVVGDGNCLFYCFLQFLVFEQHKFTETWEFKAKPVTWIRKKLRKWVEALTEQEWLDVTMCDDEEFRNDECKRIFSEVVDYYDGELMRLSDEHHGDLIECLAFAKRYRVVVVIYNCGIIVEECNTNVLMDHQTRLPISVTLEFVITLSRCPLKLLSWYDIKRI